MCPQTHSAIHERESGLTYPFEVNHRRKLEIKTLGQLSITLAGRPLTTEAWNGFKPKEIALFLAAHPGGVTRDTLIDALWDSGGEYDPGKQLNVAVSRTRRALGKQSVIREGNLYRFSSKIKVIEDAGDLLSLDISKRPELLTTALCSCQGEYLPGYYDNWIELRRQRLQAHRLELLTHLLQNSSGCSKILELARLTLSIEPCAGAAHFALIKYHLEERNPEWALRQYGNYLDVMQESGFVPDPEICQLANTSCYRLEEHTN